jgi:hypothetical protein
LYVFNEEFEIDLHVKGKEIIGLPLKNPLSRRKARRDRPPDRGTHPNARDVIGDQY